MKKITKRPLKQLEYLVVYQHGQKAFPQKSIIDQDTTPTRRQGETNREASASPFLGHVSQ